MSNIIPEAQARSLVLDRMKSSSMSLDQRKVEAVRSGEMTQHRSEGKIYATFSLNGIIVTQQL